MLINFLGLKGLMNFISANMYSQPELTFSVTRSINVQIQSSVEFVSFF